MTLVGFPSSNFPRTLHRVNNKLFNINLVNKLTIYFDCFLKSEELFNYCMFKLNIFETRGGGGALKTIWKLKFEKNIKKIFHLEIKNQFADSE